MDSNITLIPRDNTPERLDTSIRALNEPLANLLTHMGLPTENVLNPIEERRKVILSIESVLEVLPYSERQKAIYLSKFTVAISAGLFDGALNFLWDETVKSLRKLCVDYDLQYVFNVAEALSARYKGLVKEEDLEAISEFDLLEISRRIGLINDVNHKRLEHVNYLRNHASAAHPNDHEISGHEMISLLEYCLKHAITAKPDHSVVKIKTLFDNIRKVSIPASDVASIGTDLKKQPIERIDDFLQSIFGLYCDPRQEQHTKDNIEKIAPFIWPSASTDTKLRIGSKFGLYRKNGEVDRKNQAQRFLEIVDGLSFKDEDSLAAELIEKLQYLRTTHFDWNNFYNEYPHALSISQSIPKTGIPEAARKMFVKIVVLCYAGNGKGYKQGVDVRAAIIYKEFINLFGVNEIKDFLDLLNDSEFVTDLDKSIPDQRIRDVANFLKSQTNDAHLNAVLDLIIHYPSRSIHKISNDSRFKDLMKNVK